MPLGKAICEEARLTEACQPLAARDATLVRISTRLCHYINISRWTMKVAELPIDAAKVN